MSVEDKSIFLDILIAIGTVGAVIWAVARDTIVKHIYRPRLIINFYETQPPYLRFVPSGIPQQPPQHILTLCVTNKGKSVAESCKPIITRLWIKQLSDESWIYPEGWVPLPLNWVFETERQKNIDERNIVPNRPYLFNLCTINENHCCPR